MHFFSIKKWFEKQEVQKLVDFSQVLHYSSQISHTFSPCLLTVTYAGQD